MSKSETRSRARRPRLLLVAGLALALLGLALGYGAWQVLRPESAEPATLRDALARFRAGPQTFPPGLRGHAPAPGVYVYATRGFEEARVLGTRRHVYPSRTTITVAPGGCGLRTRWDALATRWDALASCPRGDARAGAGWRLASTSEAHRFLGQLDERTYRCTPASTHLPPRLRAGTTWTTLCAIPGTTNAAGWAVLGPRTLHVGGAPVRTVLLRERARTTGETTGTGLTLQWVLPRTGLLVREVVRNESTTGTVAGEVGYTERYTLALTSLTPRR